MGKTKIPKVDFKKEEAKYRKMVATNFRGKVKLKYLIDLYLFAPSQEWHPIEPTGNELLHAVRYGRPDLVIWWNPEYKQIEMNRMAKVLWVLFVHFNELPLEYI